MEDVNVKVTIGVPVYGVEKYMERCAVSLFEQTYPNIEYIFLDDCSPDRSIDILREVMDKFPGRAEDTKIIAHERNRGLAAARNTIVANATGEFIMWVDSDDYIDVHTVEKLVAAQKRDGSDIVCCGIIQIHEKYNIHYLPEKYSSSKEMTMSLLSHKVASIFVHSKLIRLGIYMENNISVEEGVNMGEDYQVSPKLAYYAKSVSAVSECLYYYDCTRGGSYSKKYSEDIFRQAWRSYEIVADFFRDKPEFANCVVRGKIYVIADILIRCVRSGNRAVFDEYSSYMKSVERRYYKHIPMRRRVLFYLRYYSLCRCYVKCMQPLYYLSHRLFG